MSWYYAHDGKQSGPISDAEFESLALSGAILDDTLVWRDGMPSWVPYRQVKPAAANPPPSLPGVPPAVASPGTAPGSAPGPGEVVCAECHRVFRQENAINYGTVWVCAECKPLFVQRLKEGTPMPAQAMRYAGFWIRVAARLIDGLIAGAILGIPLVLLVISSGILTGRGQLGQSQILAFQVFGQLAGLLFEVAYQTFFVGRFAATPGKMAVGIKVVSAEGAPVTYMRAFGRAWADRLSSLTCGIGYIIVGFDAEKRALHDHICSTRVIYK